jgi:hypothetical protein
MSTISAGTTVGTALVNTGDTTGNLVIKTGSNATTALTISGTDQSITVAGGLNLGAPVAVASGGTGANSASGARTNLGTNDAANITTGTLAIAQGGTGANTATAAFNALNPMTTTGDIIYEASPTVAARLGIGSNGQVLTVASGIPSWAALPAGGVTSLNGQTGAITNTSVDSIGSYIWCFYAINTPTATPAGAVTYTTQGATVAGSNLRYGVASLGYSRTVAGQVGVPWAGGGTALSGTWRSMGVNLIYATFNPCNGTSTGYWEQSLWVRVS